MDFKKHLLFSIGIPSIVCLLLAAALFIVGSDITSKITQMEKLRNDLFLRQQSFQSFTNLKQQFEQVKGYLPILNIVLPNQDQLVSFPRDIAIIANQNKISSNVSLGQENSQSTGQLRQTDFNLVSSGKFDDFVNFLKSLENSRYFIKINTLDVVKQDDGFKGLLGGQVFSL